MVGAHQILSALCTEAAEDLVGLWALQSWIRDGNESGLDPTSLRAVTLSIVDQALASGSIVVGSFTCGDFQIWSGDERRRIETIWSDARELSPGDNIWLSGRDLS
jgi:hypothetical protein